MIHKGEKHLTKIYLVLLWLMSYSFGATRKQTTDELLQGLCFDTLHKPEWWSYVWCYKSHVSQIKYNRELNIVDTQHSLGRYTVDDSSDHTQRFVSVEKECKRRNSADLVSRTAEVHLKCCNLNKITMYKMYGLADVYEAKKRTFIDYVQEPEPGCSYILSVCCEAVCQISPQAESVKVEDKLTRSHLNDEIEFVRSQNFVDIDEQEELRDRVKLMFMDGYDAYMKYAYPKGELRPISCEGGEFDPVKLPLLTLIDSLDTLVILGNFSEFRNATSRICSDYGLPPNPKNSLVEPISTSRGPLHLGFDVDVNISVFESTIRLLGGLLSAHIYATDPSLKIYDEVSNNYLRFERDDDNKTNLNSFSKEPVRSVFTDTVKGIFVNRERSDTISVYFYDNCLLSLALDLGLRLLPAFETATGIPYGTVNAHGGVPSGETEVASTAGAGSLLLEFETLTRLTGNTRFGDAADAAIKGLFNRKSKVGLLGKHININTGQWNEETSGIGSNSDSFYEYLLKGGLLFQSHDHLEMFRDVYYPIKDAIQVGDWFGDVDMQSGRSKRYRVESLQAFFPGLEALLGLFTESTRTLNAFMAAWNYFDSLPEEFDQVAWLSGKGRGAVTNPHYPLRPELMESVYHMYRSSGDRSWLEAAKVMLETLEHRTKVQCGFAGLSGSEAKTKPQHDDVMPSFFLSETLKYLYLTFDDSNSIIHQSRSQSPKCVLFTTEAHMFDTMHIPPDPRETKTGTSSPSLGNYRDDIEKSLLWQCMKPLWWDALPRYDPHFLDEELAALKRMNGLAPYGSKRQKQHHQQQQIWLQQQMEKESEREMRNLAVKEAFSRFAFHFEESKSSRSSVTDNHQTISPSLHSDGPPQKRKTNVCLPEEDPTLDTNTRTSFAKQEGQMMRLWVEGFGEFSVQIRQDGFLVHSLQHGDIIEIANVGQPAVFVLNYMEGETSTRTIIGEIGGLSRHCTVELIPNSACNYDSKSSKFKTLWQSSCAPAAYEPLFSEPVTAPLSVISADVSKLCSPLPSKEKSSIDIFAWLRGRFSPVHKENAVLMVQRGDCLFEEKSMNAQKSHAKALIVANNDNNLFIMSGTKDMTTKLSSATPTPQKLHHNQIPQDSNPKTASNSKQKDVATDDEGNITINNQMINIAIEESIKIPTVMLSADDATQLKKRSEEYARLSRCRPLVRVTSTAHPSILESDGDLIGPTPKAKIPRVRANPLSSLVQGVRGWGIVVSASVPKGINTKDRDSLGVPLEWQLFILGNEDMNNPNIIPWEWTVKAAGKFSCAYPGPHITGNGAEKYFLHFQQHCPASLTFDGNHIIVR